MRLSKKMALFSNGKVFLPVTNIVVNYTGNYSDTIITDATSKQYRLLTFISDGILTLNSYANAEIWYCNGGQDGSNYMGGKGADFCPATQILLTKKPTQIIIGPGNKGVTSFENFTPSQMIAGSGAGWGYGDSNADYTCGGQSTIPFGDSLNFKPHCAGGGGGGAVQPSYNNRFGRYNGMAGGTDGGASTGNTSSQINTGNLKAIGGAGGSEGGGKGGSACNYYNSSFAPNYYCTDGTDATFYGAGGGGGGLGCTSSGDPRYGANGKGYQGVLYLRLPLIN